MVLGLTAHHVVVVEFNASWWLQSCGWNWEGQSLALGSPLSSPLPAPLLHCFAFLQLYQPSLSAPSTSTSPAEMLCCITKPKQVLHGVESTRAGATSRPTYLAAMSKAASQLSVTAAGCQISSAEKQWNFKPKGNRVGFKGRSPNDSQPRKHALYCETSRAPAISLMQRHNLF